MYAGRVVEFGATRDVCPRRSTPTPEAAARRAQARGAAPVEASPGTRRESGGARPAALQPRCSTTRTAARTDRAGRHPARTHRPVLPASERVAVIRPPRDAATPPTPTRHTERDIILTIDDLQGLLRPHGVVHGVSFDVANWIQAEGESRWLGSASFRQRQDDDASGAVSAACTSLESTGELTFDGRPLGQRGSRARSVRGPQSGSSNIFQNPYLSLKPAADHPTDTIEQADGAVRHREGPWGNRRPGTTVIWWS